MIMKYDDELLRRYLAGETEIEEEQALRKAAQADNSELPSALQAWSHHVHKEQQQTASLSDDELFARLPQEEKPKSHQRFFVIPPLVWQLAAAVALLMLGFWFGRQAQPSGNLPTSYEENNRQLVALRNEMAGIKEMLLSNGSAGERLQAVHQVAYLPQTQADAELISVLINTMNFDENMNVRMAAIEALRHYRERPLVRQAFLNSLKVQTDPNVQIMLIETLVQAADSAAVPEMQELLKRPDLQEAVRQQLEQGLGQLI
jgi:hypothetical protein